MGLFVPDDLWLAIEPLLPREQAKPKGGPPRAPDRSALAGILFVLRTGIQWHEVRAELGCCGKTCWRRLGCTSFGQPLHVPLPNVVFASPPMLPAERHPGPQRPPRLQLS